MAVLAPGTIWDPLDDVQTEPRMTSHDVICLHTMAGYFEYTNDMFHDNGYGGTESHFGMRADGYTKQWQDLDFQADANLDGNPYVISIETEDHGPEFVGYWTNGSDVPPWTDQQINKIVELVGWLCDKYNIPRTLIPDTRLGRRGIAYHRQGINPWRVSDGVLWSSTNGKVCPGDRRIYQLINDVIPRLVQPVSASGLEECEMQLIRRRSDSYTMMLAGGKLFKVTGPDNWAEAEKGNTPRIILDDDEYNRLTTHLGPVLS